MSNDDRPTADPRSLLFAGDVDARGRPLPMSHGVLVTRTQRWPVTAATPEGVASLLRQSRQLFVYGLYNYENFPDAAMKSLQGVEAALRLKLRSVARVVDLARRAYGESLITDDERERLDAGRKLRNRLVHAESQPVWTPALAAEIISASHHVAARLFP